MNVGYDYLMSESAIAQIALVIGLVSAVISLAALGWARVSAMAAEKSADAATRSAAASERAVELKEIENAKKVWDEAVDRLARSWAGGWSPDSTNAAISLIPRSLLPRFKDLVREACARNPRAPKKTSDEIIESHLKRDPDLRAVIERVDGVY